MKQYHPQYNESQSRSDAKTFIDEDILIEDLKMADRTRREVEGTQIRKWFNRYPYWHQDAEIGD